MIMPVLFDHESEQTSATDQTAFHFVIKTDGCLIGSTGLNNSTNSTHLVIVSAETPENSGSNTEPSGIGERFNRPYCCSEIRDLFDSLPSRLSSNSKKRDNPSD